jgi:hypothetical protein
MHFSGIDGLRGHGSYHPILIELIKKGALV